MSMRPNPFEEFQRFLDRWSEQFGETTGSWESALERARQSSMAIDMVERDDEFVLTADLPGFEKDDIHIDVTDSMLNVEAHREETESTESEEYVHQERHSKSISRSIRLPAKPDVDGIAARYNQGVLTVTIPKAEPTAEGTAIEIE